MMLPSEFEAREGGCSLEGEEGQSMYPGADQIREAREILRGYFGHTRLVPASSLSRICGAEVWLKLESDLPTGSFKPRGALYALEQKLRSGKVTEVVASSTGNHGAAVALAGRMLGVPATIFLPKNPNPVKRSRIVGLGARIIETGGSDLSDAFDRAAEYANREGIYFLNDATDQDIPVGTATIACEILEQCPETEAIYVPMGDTGLVRGIAVAARLKHPAIRIVGVQAKRAPAYYLSWTQRRVISTDACDTIADGLATRKPLEGNVRAILDLVDDVRLVREADMLRAIRHLLLEEHIVAEPAGAASTAALMQEKTPRDKRIVLIISGANISEAILRRAINEEHETR